LRIRSRGIHLARHASILTEVPLIPGFEFDRSAFIELLVAAQCTKEMAQKQIKAKFNVRIPRTSYKRMWERLEEKLGLEGAADAVCEVVLVTMNQTVNELLTALERGKQLVRRSDEPKMVELLVNADAESTPLGDYVLDYRVRTGRSERNGQR
jgi:hypothetical protein